MTPVTIVTGFLGSGKTTLIGRLLRHPSLADAAVIVNDFGEVGLDHALVERIDGDVVLLPQGCLCCTLNGSLDIRRIAGAVPDFDQVIVETTGLASPVSVLQTVMDRNVLLRGFTPGLVVTTVDGVCGGATLDAYPEAVQQVAIADRLLLTKSDLADDPALRARLADLNPRAPLHTVVQGEIGPAQLMVASLADLALLNAADRTAVAGAPAVHSHGIATVTLRFDEPLDFAALSAWLAGLVAKHGAALLRVKGIVRVRGQERPVAVHGVQHIFHPPKLLETWPDSLTGSAVVFILDRLDPGVVWQSAAATGLNPRRVRPDIL